MTEVEALKSLGPFVLLQAACSLLIILAGVWAIFRGSREKKSTPTDGAPKWSLYGPVHDVMGAIHAMNEQSRESNRIGERIEHLLREQAKEQREQTQLLEDIRNNQVQRGDITPPPVSARRKPL